jgi:hypothetical protein
MDPEWKATEQKLMQAVSICDKVSQKTTSV